MILDARGKEIRGKAVVRFDETEFLRLRSLVSDADSAVAKQDAYINLLALKYGFDPRCRKLQWNDETCEFAFIGK